MEEQKGNFPIPPPHILPEEQNPLPLPPTQNIKEMQKNPFFFQGNPLYFLLFLYFPSVAENGKVKIPPSNPDIPTISRGKKGNKTPSSPPPPRFLWSDKSGE